MFYGKKMIPLCLALSMSVPAGYVLAQAAGGHDRPTSESMSRLQDGRIAMAKATLKLSDEQLKLWAPVEDMIRARATERQKMRAEWEQKRAAGGDKAGGDKGGDKAGDAGPKMALPERIVKMSERMTKHAEQMKAFAAVLAPLYASFSQEQKAVAGPALATLTGGHKHGGHGGGRGGHGWGHGQGGPGGEGGERKG